MDSIMKLGIVLSLRDRISSALSRIKNLGGETLKKFTDMRTAIVAVSVALVALGTAWAMVGAKMARQSGEFNYQIAGMSQIVGATPEERQALKGSAIQAGIQTQYSPIEAAQGLITLGQAGNNARQSMDALIPSLDLAAASMGELSPSSAAGLVSQMMKAYGVESRNTALGVDQLVQMTNAFSVSAAELPLMLGTASRGAQTLSQSFGETLVALGLIKNVIPTAERAGTALAVSMERLARSDVQKALSQDAGVVVQVGGKFRDFLDIIGDLTVKTAKWSEVKRAAYLVDVFGAEAMGGINAIMAQLKNGVQTMTGATVRGAAAIAYYRDQIKNAGGAAKEYREALLDTYKGVSLLLDGSLQTAAIMLGDSFESIFRPIKEFALSGVNSFIEWFSGLSDEMRLFIVAVPLAVAGIASLTLALGGAMALWGAMSYLLLSTPVGWIAAAFAALGATIVITAVYWEEISASVGGLWDRLANGGGIIEIIVVSLRNLRDVLILAAFAFYTAFADLGENLRFVGRQLSAFYGGIWDSVASSLRDVIDNSIKPIINSMVTWLDDKTGGWFSRTMGWISGGVAGLADLAGGEIGWQSNMGIRDSAQNAWDAMFGGADSSASGAGAEKEGFLDRLSRKTAEIMGVDAAGSALAGAGAGAGGGGGAGGGPQIVMYVNELKLETDTDEQARTIEGRLALMISQHADIVQGGR